MTSLHHGAAIPVAVIGGGPAGLMAAEGLAQHGLPVHVFDAMPSVGRKFLLAGRGGLNLTHAEPKPQFLSRYGDRHKAVAALVDSFDADALRAWAHGLGIDTFVGSSGRVFPRDMKAAPLLRAWLQRLRALGVQFHMRHRWRGWHAGDDALCFATPEGDILVHARATVLALGGASWARLGSDGAWVPELVRRGVAVADLRPSNCGFDLAWSEHFRSRFAGHPIKPVVLTGFDAAENPIRRRGEFVVSSTGIEGSLVYAVSAALRDAIDARGSAVIELDLLPDMELARVNREVSRPRGARSWSSHLQSRLGIAGVKAGLLRECASAGDFSEPHRIGALLKALPLRLLAARPIDEAISSAGGVRFDALNTQLMLHTVPGVFCAGEMLDWEAPTGGYLLTACFATGRAAALGAVAWLRDHPG